MRTYLSIIFIIISRLTTYAQQPNDCQFSITVCGNSNLNLDVSGIGTQELSGTNTCSSQENNSIWFQVNIATSGTLAFTLTPESASINEDYDFFIYGPNVSCGNIGQAIRCSTTNPAAANQGNNLTGLSTSASDTSEGPGANGNSFVSAINALAGESYFLVIDRPIGNSPFTLEWTGTATFPDPPVNTISPQALTIESCDNSPPINDGITQINLTNLTQDIIGSETDVAVSYHSSESDANLNTNPLGQIFDNTSTPQTIHIRIENTTSNCFILDTLEINITAFSNFNTPTEFIVCDDDTDGDDQNGFTTFDFNIKTQEITHNINAANYSISYYSTLVNAETETNMLPLIYTNTNVNSEEIFVRIDDLNTGCVGFTTFFITVGEIPAANATTVYQCDEDGIPEGLTIFNINQQLDAITSGANDVEVSYYLSLSDAMGIVNAIDGDAYANISNPQTIVARLVNTITGCVNYNEVTLAVSTTSIYNASLQACDADGTEDGLFSFNLEDANPIVLAGAPVGLPAVYYETYNDALLEINPITSAFYTNTTPYNQTIFARVENDNACFGISEVELTVFELPNIETTFETLYCLNDFPETIVLDGGLIDDEPSHYLYEWSTGETTTEIEVNTPGTYSVRVINTNGCFKERTITVLPSNIAEITDVIVMDAMDLNSIAIEVMGEGEYTYALNDIDGPYQSSPIFNNLQPGFYTVFVKDIKNNCGIEHQLVSVIGFPKFFTPNDDGKFDFWKIKGISAQFQPNSKIFIFNRHGKLITKLDPLGAGWDGIYNGKKMPTSDYWFMVTLQDGRVFNGHFTLKQ